MNRTDEIPREIVEKIAKALQDGNILVEPRRYWQTLAKSILAALSIPDLEALIEQKKENG